MNQDIVNVIKAYEKSLNASDAEAALALYGDDPIFMPQYSAALSGRDAVKAGYEKVFSTLKLIVNFTIHEVVEMGDFGLRPNDVRRKDRNSRQENDCERR